MHLHRPLTLLGAAALVVAAVGSVVTSSTAQARPVDQPTGSPGHVIVIDLDAHDPRPIEGRDDDLARDPDA